MNPAIEGLARALFEEAGDALILFEPDTDRIVDANPVALRLTGFSREAILHLPATQLFIHGDPGATASMRRASANTGVFHSQEGYFLRTHKEGVWIPVGLTLSRLHVRPKTLALITARDARAQRQAQARLERAEAELRRVMASVSDCLWSAEVDGSRNWIYRYLSPVVEKITGQPPDYFMADPRRWEEMIHPEDRKRCQEALSNLTPGPTPLELQYRLVRPGGGIRWVRDSIMVAGGPDGVTVRLNGVLTDITERQRTDRAQTARHSVTRALAEAGTLQEATTRILQILCDCVGWQIGILWVLDRNTDQLRCLDLWHVADPRFDEFATYTRQLTFSRNEGLPGRVWNRGRPAWVADITRAEGFARESALRAGLRGGVALPVLFGSEVTGVIEFLNLEVRQPEPDLLVILGDLGSQLGQFLERKRVEAEAARERYLVHALMDLIPDAIYFKDTNSRFTRVNKAMARAFGLSHPDEAVGKSDFDFFAEEHARQAYLDEQEVIRRGQSLVGKEEKETWADGRTTWVSTTKVPFTDPEGCIEGIFGLSRDITALKMAQEERDRFFTMSLDLLCIADFDGFFKRLNPAFERLLGYTRAELMARPFLDFVHQDDHAATRAVMDSLLAGKDLLAFENRYRCKDGSYKWLAWTATPVCEEQLIYATARDVTERKRVEERLQAQAQLLDMAHDAIIVRNLDNRILYWNHGAETLYGWTAEQARGSVSQSLLRTTFPISQQAVEQTLLTEGYWEGELIHTRKGDGQVVVESRQSIKRDLQGRPTGILEINRDITERKRSEEQLRRAMEAAEAASKAKSEFLANMSHEIRTPMNGVLGMTELALDTELTAEQRQYLELSQASAESLLSVINDILDFSKIEAGKLDLDLIDFPLRESLGSTVKTLALRAHQKGLELACRVAPDVPDYLLGDPSRLRQIIVNLVGNAIKFTEEGDVVVDVEVESRTNDEISLHFAVSDTGIGIPENKQQLIFEAFAQADASTTRDYGGSGLGLTISSRLVAMMGGRIWVESESEKGSTFHFTARFDAREQPLADKQPRKLEGLPVLGVDDNATNRRILSEVLTGWHMKPTVVENAIQALAALEQAEREGEPFALILLDSDMPGMDGFGLAEHIRQKPELSGARIMMLSSAGRQGDISRCRDLGIARYLLKPLKQSELLEAILAALEATFSYPGSQVGRSPGKREIVQDRATEPADPATHVAGSPSATGLRSVRVLLAEDNVVNQRLAVRLLEKRGYQAVVAINGRKALEALEKRSFDLVLMDVQMPEMGGFEATEAIRAQERVRGGHIPIIAMTAHALKGDRERCLAVGMDDYVAKPIRAEELWRAIEAVLPQQTTPAEIPVEAPLTGDGLNYSEASARVGGDLQLLRELTAMFLKEFPGWLAEAQSAINRGDRVGLQRAAHTLKGALGIFGAAGASAAALELELCGRDGNLTDAPRVYQTLENALEKLRPALLTVVGEPAM